MSFLPLIDSAFQIATPSYILTNVDKKTELYYIFVYLNMKRNVPTYITL